MEEIFNKNHRLLLILASVTVLVSITCLASIQAFAFFPDCGYQCTASNVQIYGIFISHSGGNQYDVTIEFTKAPANPTPCVRVTGDWWVGNDPIANPVLSGWYSDPFTIEKNGAGWPDYHAGTVNLNTDLTGRVYLKNIIVYWGESNQVCSTTISQICGDYNASKCSGDVSEIAVDLDNSITINKQIINGSTGNPEFEFTGDLGTFSLYDGGSMVFEDLFPSIYTVTENPPSLWGLDSINISGDDGASTTNSSSADIELDDGEYISVTFNNREIPISVTGSPTLEVSQKGTTTEGKFILRNVEGTGTEATFAGSILVEVPGGSGNYSVNANYYSPNSSENANGLLILKNQNDTLYQLPDSTNSEAVDLTSDFGDDSENYKLIMDFSKLIQDYSTGDQPSFVINFMLSES